MSRRGRSPPMEYRMVPLVTQKAGCDFGTVSRDVGRLEAMETQTLLLDLFDFKVGVEAYEDGTAFGRMASLAHAATGRRLRLGSLRFVDRFVVGEGRRVGSWTRPLKNRCPFGDGVDELLEAEGTAFSFRFEFLLNQDMRHVSQSLVDNVHD